MHATSYKNSCIMSLFVAKIENFNINLNWTQEIMAGQKKKPRYSEETPWFPEYYIGWIGIGNCGQKTSINFLCLTISILYSVLRTSTFVLMFTQLIWLYFSFQKDDITIRFWLFPVYTITSVTQKRLPSIVVIHYCGW